MPLYRHTDTRLDRGALAVTLTLPHSSPHTPCRSVPSGALVLQTVCQNGLPPQIRDLKWSPGQQFTEFITREHSGPCDLICTAGERHIRVWSFSRPGPGPPAAVVGGKSQGSQPPVAASLVYRGATMGKVRSHPVDCNHLYLPTAECHVTFSHYYDADTTCSHSHPSFQSSDRRRIGQGVHMLRVCALRREGRPFLRHGGGRQQRGGLPVAGGRAGGVHQRDKR